jgi:hypothetical protein
MCDHRTLEAVRKDIVKLQKSGDWTPAHFIDAFEKALKAAGTKPEYAQFVLDAANPLWLKMMADDREADGEI